MPSILTSTAAGTVSEVQPLAPTREVIDVVSIPATSLPTKDSVDFKTVKFKDIVITDESSNMVSSNNKKSTTKLQSVLRIPIVDINNPENKSIAKALGISGCRK